MILDSIHTDAVENVQSVPITNGNTYAFTILYSVPVQMEATNIALMLVQAEISNPYDFNVGLGTYICRAASPNDPIGRRVIPATMSNVPPDLHHSRLVLWGMDSGAAGLIYYNVVVYAVGFGNCGNMVAEQGYGRLTVMKFKV